MRRYHLSYPNLRDGTGSFAGEYGTDQLPESFIVDRDGHVVTLQRGEISQQFVDRAIALARVAMSLRATPPPAARAAAARRALASLLAVAPAAGARTARRARSLPQIERQVMCVTCKIPLNVAESPQADRERAYIQSLIDRGQSEAQIKRALVGQYGPTVLGLPERARLRPRRLPRPARRRARAGRAGRRAAAPLAPALPRGGAGRAAGAAARPPTRRA